MVTSNYMPDVVVEIAFNAGYATAPASRTWTDVSAYVELDEGIDISLGRSDERGTPDANRLTLTLDNRDGRFTPGKASGAYYPNVKIGKPIRVKVTPPGASQSTRFVGFIDEWPISWPGSDASSSVQITAYSRLARLGLDAALRSTLVEHTLALETPSVSRVYWPLTEAADSTQAVDLIAGKTLDIDLSPTLVDPGQDVTFGVTGPRYSSGSGVAVSGYGTRMFTEDAGQSDLHFASCFARLAVDPGALFINLWRIGATPEHFILLDISSTGVTRCYINNGTTQSLDGTTLINDGEWHHIAANVSTGTNNWELYVDGVLEATGTVSGSWSTGVRNTAAVGWNFISPTQPVTVEVAHAYASAQTLTATEILDMANAGLTGLAGETCSARLARYAAWSGIPSTDTAFDTGESVLTAIDTAGASPVESMRKVAAADQGVLFDARDGTLTFKSRAARPIATSALTLDLSTHIVQDDFNPKLDRSALVNDCTVTAEGQQIRYFDATSRDDYGPHTLSLELATTSAHANSIASWIVNVNKTPAVRVPSLSIDPLPLSSGSWNSLLGITIGSVVTVTNQPTQMASTSNVYFVEGYSEKYGPESVTFTFNVSPAEATLSTFVIEGGTPRGQLDSSAILAQ